MISRIGSTVLVTLVGLLLALATPAAPTRQRAGAPGPSPQFLTEWGSTGTGPGQFLGPRALCVDAGGNVYVVDTGNQRIQVFSSEGVYLAEIHSPAGSSGSYVDVARDALGTLYAEAADTIQVFGPDLGFRESWSLRGNDGSLAIDPSGHELFVVAGNEVVQFSVHGDLLNRWMFSIGAPAIQVGFDVGPDGDVYLAGVPPDSSHSIVRRFSSDGQLRAQWSGLPFAGDIISVGPVSVDAAGHAFTTDSYGRVQEFTTDGTPVVWWWAEGATPGVAGDHLITDIGTDASGNVYLLDPRYSQVQKFGPTSMTPVVPLSWGALMQRFR